MEATRDKHEWAYRAWLKPALGHRKIGSITRDEVNKVLREVTERGRSADTRIAVYQR